MSRLIFPCRCVFLASIAPSAQAAANLPSCFVFFCLKCYVYASGGLQSGGLLCRLLAARGAVPRSCIHSSVHSNTLMHSKRMQPIPLFTPKRSFFWFLHCAPRRFNFALLLFLDVHWKDVLNASHSRQSRRNWAGFILINLIFAIVGASSACFVNAWMLFLCASHCCALRRSVPSSPVFKVVVAVVCLVFTLVACFLYVGGMRPAQCCVE